MIFKRFLVAVVMALAACEMRQAAPPTETPAPTPTPEVTEEVQTIRWIETEMNGVSLGMWRPIDWQTDLSDGLVVAEEINSTNNPDEQGIIIHCFVPPLDDFDPSNVRPNYAWAVLDWVVKMPDHTGWDVAMTQPEGFTWDQHEAAYYLFTTGDSVRGIVLAVRVPGEERVVVCNVSAPMSHANRIRPALPGLLDGLMVGANRLNGTALGTLPNPLSFPRYNRNSYSGESDLATTVSN